MVAPQIGENHFCFNRACTARGGGGATTKPVGPGFNGSEPATRMEGNQIGHEQDGMNHEMRVALPNRRC